MGGGARESVWFERHSHTDDISFSSILTLHSCNTTTTIYSKQRRSDSDLISNKSNDKKNHGDDDDHYNTKAAIAIYH